MKQDFPVLLKLKVDFRARGSQSVLAALENTTAVFRRMAHERTYKPEAQASERASK